MFQVKDLMLLPTMARANLIAGESGLNNRVRWSYKAESMEIADWVHGRELLIISSGVMNSEHFNLEELIMEAIRLRLSGALILEGGPYVQTISDRIRTLADRNHFPLIGLPGTIPLVDVFEELGHAIAYHDRVKYKHGDLLTGILFEASPNKEMVKFQAQAAEYVIEGPQRIFMVHLDFQDPSCGAYYMQEMQNKLEELFQHYSAACISSWFSSNLVGLTGEAREDILDMIFTTLLTELSPEITTCRIGIGTAYESIDLWRESFTEASKTVSILEKSSKDRCIQWFERLGFLRVLLSMSNTELLIQYRDEILSNILKYDLSTEGHLLETLETWFACDENMKEAAIHLFTHPNTVKYRLLKVEELTGLKLSRSKDRLELQNAIMIHNYIGR